MAGSGRGSDPNELCLREVSDESEFGAGATCSHDLAVGLDTESENPLARMTQIRQCLASSTETRIQGAVLVASASGRKMGFARLGVP